MNQRSITTSGELRDLDTRFTLNDSDTVPHVSLYMANIRSEHLPEVSRALSGVAGRTPDLPLQAQRYGNNEHGMFEVFYGKTDDIVRLQDDVIAAVNPWRDGMRERDPVGRSIQERVAQASGELQHNFARSGYDEVGSYFNPHITLTRLSRPEHGPAQATLPSLRDFDGTFNQFALYRMGEHGTCIEQVASRSTRANQHSTTNTRAQQRLRRDPERRRDTASRRPGQPRDEH